MRLLPVMLNPERKEAAATTLLTYDDDYGGPNIFAIAFENVVKPDVVSALHTQGYLESGWSCTIDTKELPPSRRTIRPGHLTLRFVVPFSLTGLR